MTIEAPSIDAMKKYLDKQHLSGITPNKGDTPEAMLGRMRPYLNDIYSAQDEYALPDNLLKRVLYQESAFQPDVISGERRSSVGAVGIAQFMEETAKDQGVDPLNPKEAIRGAAKYLSDLKEQTGSWEGAVAAYNWGPGNLAKHGIRKAPKETRDYLSRVSADVPEVARGGE